MATSTESLADSALSNRDTNFNKMEQGPIPSDVTIQSGVTTTAGIAIGVLVQPVLPVPRRSFSSGNVVVVAPETAKLEAKAGNEATLEASRDMNIDELKKTKAIQSLEIEQAVRPSLELSRSEDSEDPMAESGLAGNSSRDDDLNDDDMEGLLEHQANDNNKRHGRKTTTRRTQTGVCVCWTGQKIGNTTVFWPYMYRRTGWGMMGPHVFGPPCVLILLWSSSWYFTHRAFLKVGWMTAFICIMFTIVATFYFMDAAFRDPGIVKPAVHDRLDLTFGGERPPPPDRKHRWCDLCQAYQPPTGAHCPECNVCVAGYDHHCAWMGCCIGQENYRPFLRFNITWLVYLAYAIIWVTLLGPVLFQNSHRGQSVVLKGGT